ncbi:TPA: efflux transporter outer membrane subunit [Legionella pneumophila]|nr:efflux transporter outer membrane subunit [Legionella pneumophila]HBC0466011.1 efflux transporter outer membrane subunit [Legionella pneumophila]HDV6633501.1 efflux transporter outer membrane subunit [Legionella pneumophila]
MDRKLVLLFSISCLFGCTVGPNYQRPDIKIQEKWPTNKAEIKTSSSAPINLTWWKSFRDPLLDQYINEAATNNLDIKIAEARIRQARAMKQMSIANFYPQINGSAIANSLQISKGTLEGIFANSPTYTLIDRNQWIYNLGFDAQWELDLFGKTRRKVEASKASLEEAYESRRTILLSTIAEIARSYVELRGAQQLYGIAQKNVELQRKTLTLVRQRYKAGVSSEVDVSLAEGQLKNTESVLPNYIAQIQANAYQIAVMLGKDPQAILKDIAKPQSLPKPPRKVPMGLRADILRQRPDIRATERQLASAVAEIGVAVADFFPQFNLSISNLALQSTSVDTLFQSSSGFWIMGPQVSLPIFHGGQIRANVESKKAAAQQAAIQYKKVILEALQEVQSALVRYSQSLDTSNSLRAAIIANKRAVQFAKKRFQYGEDDYLSLLQSEAALLNAETQEVNSEVSSLTALVSLYKALGGGWESFEA